MTLKHNQTVGQSVTMTFDTLATPVRFAERPPDLIVRFSVTRQDTIRAAAAGLASAGR
jgi:ABC-type taurine transport system substrate-binding protein